MMIVDGAGMKIEVKRHKNSLMVVGAHICLFSGGACAS
jgi:hypothetical protein